MSSQGSSETRSLSNSPCASAPAGHPRPRSIQWGLCSDGFKLCFEVLLYFVIEFEKQIIIQLIQLITQQLKRLHLFLIAQRQTLLKNCLNSISRSCGRNFLFFVHSCLWSNEYLLRSFTWINLFEIFLLILISKLRQRKVIGLTSHTIARQLIDVWSHSRKSWVYCVAYWFVFLSICHLWLVMHLVIFFLGRRAPLKSSLTSCLCINGFEVLGRSVTSHYDLDLRSLLVLSRSIMK